MYHTIHHGSYIGVSSNGGTQQPWVFLLKMIILGVFGVPPFKETPRPIYVLRKGFPLPSWGRDRDPKIVRPMRQMPPGATPTAISFAYMGAMQEGLGPLEDGVTSLSKKLGSPRFISHVHGHLEGVPQPYFT